MLTIQHLSKSYGKTIALETITLNIQSGTCFGLIGPNGAGKSTLIKIIAGIIKSDTGTITFQETHGNIGYVPQEICLVEQVSAIQNLYFFGRLYHLNSSQLKSRALEVLSRIGLSEQKNNKVNTFSGGMKRRLNIGCALMNNPNLLIMDEPTVGIDPQSREYILNLIQEMTTENCTIIYSTHYMEEAERICDGVAFMDRGKVIKQGKLNNLLHSHVKPTIYFQTDQPLQALEHMQKKGNGYSVITDDPMREMEQLIQLAQKNDINFTRFELATPKLEDIFFSMTGKELRDKGGQHHDSTF